ncbi:MAG: hypothetical protein CMJ78_03365 [Planctomycetaceae bacterium]|nr:hypothetical protein [Planctomycetaceae bacterium]
MLAVLADAVTGHTTGRVYPFLTSTNYVLSEVRNEATADSLVERIRERREESKSVVDLRALDLLEMLVERRSSEVQNQPGEHIQRALTAMQRAFKREWSAGEPRLMAQLLASMGRISQKQLAEEQMRELNELLKREELGTLDRLHIAYHLAQCERNYGGLDDATALLKSEIVSYEERNGRLPAHVNHILSTYISYLEAQRHYIEGERELQTRLDEKPTKQQRDWLMNRMFALYESAMGNNGQVSFGKGKSIFEPLLTRIYREMDKPSSNQRYQLTNRLSTVFRRAKDIRVENYKEKLQDFAFNRVQRLLQTQTNYYTSMVQVVARMLQDLISPHSALEFYIVCIEKETKWFRLKGQDGWGSHAWHIGQLFQRIGKKPGKLEDRLLAIALKELRNDLQSGRQRNRVMYHRHNSYFWDAKQKDFLRVANEVWEQNKESGHLTAYIAEYMFSGLYERSRAIEIMYVGYNAGRLSEGAQSRLAHYLHETSRHAEAIPILVKLMKQRPSNLSYRTRLMHCYYRVGDQEKLMALLEATDKFLHEHHMWVEGTIAALAYSCYENKLWKEAAAYYEEVIPLHQRIHPNRGIGNGTLSSYYNYIAQCYANLGDTIKAVDAAGGAIVSWGRSHNQRSNALYTLRKILSQSKDLEGYVEYLDKQAEETGLHNAIVRKALGQVYSEKRKNEQAVTHLKIALELQPNDTETHQALVACYQSLDDQEALIDQLFASVQLSRRNIQLYKNLAQRLHSMKRKDEAERAYTSIVEVLPAESESHTALAEIRQTHGDWRSAIDHWKRVVEIRSLEPTGLLRLATAQIQVKDWDEANDTIDKLKSKTWPSRFGDISQQANQLQRQIKK